MKSKKIFVVILSVIFVLILGGCTKHSLNTDDIKDDTVVFKYGDNIITKAEVYIYINVIKERYEKQYGEDVWALSLPTDNDETISMVNLTKQEVVEEIIKVKTFMSHAEEVGIELTDSELDKIDEDARKFYDGLTDEEKVDMDLTLQKATQVMKENYISKKVEEKILEDAAIEISDEQARETTFYDMYFECYSLDENGNVVPFDNEQKRAQYEQALAACSTLATAKIDGSDVDENIERLSEYYKLEHSKEQTLTPDEILETYGEDIYNTLYSMKNGDYSTVVESEYGYHVFLMIALTDKDATSQKKAEMTKKEIDNKINETVNSWKKDIDSDFSYPDSVNMEVYDSIKLDTN